MCEHARCFLICLQDRVALLEGQLLRRSSHVTPRPEHRSRLSDAQAGASSAPAEAATSSAAVAAPQLQTPSDAPAADAGRVRRAMSGVSRSMDWAASGMGVGPGLANGGSGLNAAGVSSSLSALPGRVSRGRIHAEMLHTRQMCERLGCF